MKIFKSMSHKKISAILAFITLLAHLTFAGEPVWWKERGVVSNKSNQASSKTIEENYQLANVGQLKHFAAKAAEELNEKLNFAGGAGDEINALVASFTKFNSQNPEANYEIANLGQLKNIAEVFYRRLRKLRSGMVIFPNHMTFKSGGTYYYNHIYPWNAMSASPTEEEYAANYAPLNLGQLKFIFGWSVAGDSDSDGVPDAWVIYYHGYNYPWYYDLDYDGLNNLEEYFLGTNPANWDSDGDGIYDGQEVLWGTDVLNPSSHPSSFASLPYFEDFESHQLGAFAAPAYAIKKGSVELGVLQNEKGRSSKFLNVDFSQTYKLSSYSMHFQANNQNIAWVDFWMDIENMEGDWEIPEEELKSVNFYFKDEKLYYYTSRTWRSVDVKGLSGWHRITVKKNFTYESGFGSTAWSMWIDGKRIVNSAGMNYSRYTKGFREFKILGSGGDFNVDNLSASNAAPTDYGTFDDDNDGLTNAQEAQYGTNPQSSDTDYDGINDKRELELGRNPKVKDKLNDYSPNELKDGFNYLWSCDFSQAKGYVEASLLGQQFWYAENAHITNLESVELLLSEGKNYAIVQRDAFGENANKLWVGFDAILAPNDLPDAGDLDTQSQAVIIAPDAYGDVYCYNPATASWQNITPENFDKQAWHRYEMYLDYTTGVAKVYIDAPETSEEEGAEAPSISTVTPAATVSFDNTQGAKKFKKFVARNVRDNTSSAHISSADNHTHLDNIYVSTKRKAAALPSLPENLTEITNPEPEFIDENSNQIDDRWEIEHFGRVLSGDDILNPDVDEDGITDLDEFLLGVPSNHSTLKTEDIKYDNNSMIIEVSTSSLLRDSEGNVETFINTRNEE